MPGAGFKAYAKRVLPDTLAMIDLPYSEGCSLIVSKTFSLHVLPNSTLAGTLSRKEMEQKASYLAALQKAVMAFTIIPIQRSSRMWHRKCM